MKVRVHGSRHGLEAVMVRISVANEVGFTPKALLPVVELFAEPDYPEGKMEIERTYHNLQLTNMAHNLIYDYAVSTRDFYRFTGRKSQYAEMYSLRYIKYLLRSELIAEAVVSAIDLLSSPAYTENDVIVDFDSECGSPEKYISMLINYSVDDFS